jgi:4-amino-4-deoxy-L-arabinose transferase-like glycosyltransferase
LTESDRGLRRALNSPLVLALVIFALALGPRLLDLGVFVGPDEFSWVTRSADFARALAEGDLRSTYQTGHPGVTLLWVETLGAGVRYGWQSLSGPANWDAIAGSDRTMALLSGKRQIVGVANALLLVLGVLLARRIFGSGVAWVAGLLLAFEPFLLTESRALRTEGLLTSFSLLTILSLLLYMKEPRLRYGALAGLLTGLALLSKVSAAALLPVGALVVGGMPFLDAASPLKARGRAAALALLTWGGMMAITVFALWPALWVAPVEVAQKMVDYVALRAVEGGGGGKSFFLGQPYPDEDPGPLFYPVVLLYRTGPWLWAGLILLAATFRSDRWQSRQSKVAIAAMALYLAAYLALITRSDLKYDRYIIPMLPILDVMAALGLIAAWRWLSARVSRAQSFGPAMAGLVLVGQMVLAIPHHPYYYTYWNPLLGGLKGAVAMLPVGGGDEGIDKIAAYLGTLPHPERLTLATANSQRIEPLFAGRTIPMTNLDGQWFLADYTMIYISQLQRGKHDLEIVQYLKRKPLEFSFAFFGVDYGWLYRGPAAQYYGGDTTLEGRATLHAYDLSAAQLSAGQALTVTVYFRNEGQRPSDRFYVRLVDADGYAWADAAVRPRPGFEDAFRAEDAIVEGEAALRLPVGMPPGQYVLKMGYEDAGTGQFIGEFVLPAGNDRVTVELPPVFPPPGALGAVQAPQPLSLVLQDELKVAGYGLNTERVAAGGVLWLTLYWQALTDVKHDYVVAVQLLDAQGSEATYWLGRPVHSGYPTTRWQSGQVVQDVWRLALPAKVSPGDYTLRAVVFDAETQAEVGRTSLGRVSVIK